ncbi:MAG: hypothetical protein IPM26_12610 [Saprospiraceae bacterium]|nr:hypothetical protein [Saprospiraceae bacterium]
MDAGYYRPATIGDFVWDDKNANGVQDAGEPGIPGLTVTLSGTAGRRYAGEFDDSNGSEQRNTALRD